MLACQLAGPGAQRSQKPTTRNKFTVHTLQAFLAPRSSSRYHPTLCVFGVSNAVDKAMATGSLLRKLIRAGADGDPGKGLIIAATNHERSLDRAIR